ncbi:MAG: hypothetical protein WD738_05255 [Pirellulales bacterium]
MRIRFSLRTFFILVTLFACCCYVWLIRPSAVAARFATAINTEDYHAADQFLRPDERFLVEWAEKRWAFTARCDLRPLTLAQLLSARRHADVHISYFELDHTATRQAELAATPLGLTSPSISSVKYGGMFIDAVRESSRPIPRR